MNTGLRQHFFNEGKDYVCLMLVNEPVKREALMMQKTEIIAVSSALELEYEQFTHNNKSPQSKRQR